MIFYIGLDSAINKIREHLDTTAAFSFKRIENIDSMEDGSQSDVFIVGPEVINPVKNVQKIAEKDKHLSILIFCNADQINRVKRSLQFSPFVGKNTTCVTFNPNSDFTSVFNMAALRTRQKRGYNEFSFVQKKLSTLTSSSVKLRNLGFALEHAPIAVLLLNQTRHIIGANKRSRQMFPKLDSGVAMLESIFAEEQLSAIKKLIENNDDHEVTADAPLDDNYEFSSSKYVENEETYTLLLVNDLTEKKEKDKRIQAILESLPQMAWTTTAEGKVNYYTQGWYAYTNQTPQEALADGWKFIIHPHDLKLSITRWEEAMTTGKVFQHAARFRRFDGEYRWHLSRAVPVHSRNHDITMWVGTSTDIHNQVLQTEELERKVKERTRSLEETNAELEQFAYVSSHDLQEPLRKIHTFAHLIKDNSLGMLDESARKYLDKIITTTTRMSGLLKDLLSFKQLHNQEPVSPVRLNDIIGSVTEDLELAILQSKAAIQVENLPVIDARPSQIKQLFYNLLNNSIKFKNPEVAPLICIRACKLTKDEVLKQPNLVSRDDHWEIIVKDNGIGFDQQYAHQIFTVFQRLHGRSAYEGTGIGLAICKKVVSNHQGEIFAVSSPGNGAEFHIILPEHLVA
jgi:PAS domain S-box-containing protein